ncbi:hypothetical protein PSN45_000129 [Yamadazyma tenuis]|uniref:Uncharacterized protein n=1 Tax=Candida tenuis (strain ATCC 10573 / BCRC 21748 / CBS 615 / JCM 9827 / NBRC 10315 / NRRL Y-1498 / VKM Y-70) TaxID=590646 RepID=G3BAV4_CANTC|nr:uncharacterized protein CANTEDRAFT_108425 [Yamadazyma tenuis ATCC 10573]EGV61461.1 hypothetical protein CANTEDRAFT_108425 [Yamadazyma tenuis ATCC 10573]WEJ92674.1 hypothetical protein PSN45_000129 [Yamadazyma tenuis]
MADNERVYYSTGRGGAGNITSSKQVPSPKLVPQGSNTPQLNNDFISTGRGGFGNIVKNDDPKLTRKLQDVDGHNEIHPVTSNKSFIGRGGYGNFINADKKKDRRDSSPENLYTVVSNGPDNPNSKSFLSKVTGFFKK